MNYNIYVHIHLYTSIYTSIYLYIYIFIAEFFILIIIRYTKLCACVKSGKIKREELKESGGLKREEEVK